MEISLKVDGGLRVVWAGSSETNNKGVNMNKNLGGFTPQILSYLSGGKPWSFSKAYAALKGRSSTFLRIVVEFSDRARCSTSCQSDLPLGGSYCVDRLDFYCGIDKCQCGAAEGFVFAEDQGEVAANLASDMGMATNTLARTSSCTLERAIKPTPTSAATKRLSSS